MHYFRMCYIISSVILAFYLTGCVQVEPLVNYYYYDPFSDFHRLPEESDVYQSQLAEWNEALSKNENDMTALYYRGILYAEASRFDDAIDDLTKVSTLSKTGKGIE